MTPKTLYMYNDDSNSTKCERKRVVKDFCFPDGIELTLLKSKGNDMSHMKYSQRIQDMLYQHGSQIEQYFVFTLNASEDAQAQTNDENDDEVLETFPGESQSDRYYNCLCIIFNEIVSTGYH